jgi:hypothetical protein
MQWCSMTDQLIRDYYRCFNERRIPDAGLLFAPDAVLEMPPFVQRAHGYAAYAHFAETWLRAFPDAVFTMERMEQHNETMCEVDIIATGTHSGPLDLVVGRFARRARPRLVRQAWQAADAKPFPPLADAVARHAQRLGHGPVREPLGTGQHDARPDRQSLCRFRSTAPLLKRAAFVVSQQHGLIVAFSRHAAQGTRAVTEVQDFF